MNKTFSILKKQIVVNWTMFTLAWKHLLCTFKKFQKELQEKAMWSLLMKSDILNQVAVSTYSLLKNKFWKAIVFFHKFPQLPCIIIFSVLVDIHTYEPEIWRKTQKWKKKSVFNQLYIQIVCLLLIVSKKYENSKN